MFVLFLLGTALASFLNLLIRGGGSLRENLRRDRSQCESCKHTLRWWELIPILSWVLLRGKCARCKSPIPVFHPISELALGSAMALTYISAESVAQLLWMELFVLILYFFAVYDLTFGIVPNKILLPITGITIAIITFLSIYHSDALLFANALLAALINFAFFALINVITRIGGMPGVSKGRDGFGWGDAKYALFLGLVLGWPAAFLGVWIGVLAGAIVGVAFLLMSKSARSKQAARVIPFVPFLSFGAWVALLWGDAIIEVITRQFWF